MDNRLIIITGAYGSGKSEYSVYLAQYLNQSGEDVVLVDMDVVNPYFRSRDVRDEFAKIGIEVVAPEGAFSHADLPMISPRIMGMIENTEKTVILDVGGDPAGCRALGRFVDKIIARQYHMELVINTLRPFTSTADEILIMKDQIEHTAKLQINEFVCNTNLMEFTDVSIITEGIDIISTAARSANVIFNRYLVMDNRSDEIPDGLGGKMKTTLRYTLKKPWERLILKGI